MLTLIWQKPRLHDDATSHRKVSWLELFFDLVFMVVISELVHLLTGDFSVEMVRNYVLLFIPAWWIWIGATYYNDRFETEGLENRFFTFLLMLPVAGLAIFAHHTTTNLFIGYGVCYLIARIIIVIMWIRAAYHEPRFRPVGAILISGYGLSILLFFVSILLDQQIRLALWSIALGFDLLTPLFTLKRQRQLPSFSMSKLPERLGLFILIVIGETLIGVIRGIARHKHLSFRIFSEGIMGVAISFGLWWIYFDFIARKPPKSENKTMFVWSYLHLVIVMAIGAVGASLLTVLTSKHHIPSDSARYLFTLSLAVTLSFIGLVETVLKREENEPGDLKTSVVLKFLSAFLICLIGYYGHQLHAFALLGMVFGSLSIPIIYGGYLWFTISQTGPFSTLEHSDRSLGPQQD